MEPDRSRLSRRARIARGKDRRARLQERDITVEEALSRYSAASLDDRPEPATRAERIARGEQKRAQLAGKAGAPREKTAAWRGSTEASRGRTGVSGKRSSRAPKPAGRKILSAVCAAAAAAAVTLGSFAGALALLRRQADFAGAGPAAGKIGTDGDLAEAVQTAAAGRDEAAAQQTEASGSQADGGERSSLEASGQEGAETGRSSQGTESAAAGTAAAPAAVSVAPEIPPVTIHLVAVGDNLMHRSVSLSGLQADGTYNYDYNFRFTADDIAAADLACINQETVIGGNELGISGYPTFNGRTEMADELAKVGFDVVLGANNHILDQNAQGVLHMLTYFNTNYPQISVLGIHGSWETRDAVTVREVNGIRLGLINYTDILNIPSFYNGNEYLVDYLDYDRLAALIAQAKAQSDFVIVFPHWGTEYNLATDAKQAQEAAFLAQQGVDLVIGTHPHVVEPVDYIDRPDGGKMLIYYSLGNYQSIQNKEMCIIGGMAQVDITRDGLGTRVSDFNMEFLATDYRMSMTRELDYYDMVTTYPWEMYSMDLSRTSWAHYDNPSFDDNLLFRLEAQMAAQVAQKRAEAGFAQ